MRVRQMVRMAWLAGLALGFGWLLAVTAWAAGENLGSFLFISGVGFYDQDHEEDNNPQSDDGKYDRLKIVQFQTPLSEIGSIF